jgi:nicotinamidase-related amidase
MERAYGLEIPKRLAEACHPRRTALLVYDMQVGVIHQIANGSQVVARVKTLLEAVRGVGMRVFFTRHMSLPKEASGVSALRMAMAWQRVSTVTDVKPWFLRDSPGFALVPELEPLPSDVIFDKITMSAFEGTPLNIVLRDCAINSILIAGVATEIGIEPTVRHAVDLGYIPIVVMDACGAGHAEAAERALASIKFMGDAILTDIEEVRRVLGSGSPAAAESNR